MKIRIGSRGSALALWQARWVAEQLSGSAEVSIEVIKTTGDMRPGESLATISGKGAFTKEIEDAMLEGRVDIAVHSLKDLPTTLPAGLVIGAITEREDPRDALVSAGGHRLGELQSGALVGTSSPRRRALLLDARPDVRIVDIRGNIDTRLRKLEAGELDAVVLACAGLRRLGLDERITEALDPLVIVPAVGQGALGIETRLGEEDAVRILNHAETSLACTAERAFLAAFGGGCAIPVAAHAIVNDGSLKMCVAVGREGGDVVRLEGTGDSPGELGSRLAREAQRH